MRLQNKEYQHYRLAIAICLGMMAVIGLFILFYGKQQSFLYINGLHSLPADYLFYFYTYLGDGIIWVPVFIYVLAYKRSYLIAVISSLIICTLLTHFFKQVVYAGEPRPLKALHDLARAVPLMHGKDVYVNSFPSGHTSLAFTLALLLAVIINKKWAAIFFPLVAFFVGYSRVYLAQHFVTDVLAGIIVGISTSYLSILVHLYFRKKGLQQSAKATA